VTGSSNDGSSDGADGSASNTDSQKRKRGRPKGSTDANKRKRAKLQLQAETECTKRYKEALEGLPLGSDRVPRGTLRGIAESDCGELGIPEYADNVKYHAVR